MLKKPDDVTVTEGEEAKFEAEVFGKPEPEVVWYVKFNVLY